MFRLWRTGTKGLGHSSRPGNAFQFMAAIAVGSRHVATAVLKKTAMLFLGTHDTLKRYCSVLFVTDALGPGSDSRVAFDYP